MNSINPQNNPKSPSAGTVQRYKAAFMQRVADHVRLSYTRWTAGTVSAERA
ncbi:hypothetical protein [Parapusillimonas granuli]|uniref:Uncharacterized protein n=1 Tax=Parapusillimonas granuli TaxID=380911 RepID=A0A853G0R1_9BURK|nr:hypothetical protein [Parapusillimonas granuli]MBB5217644.1 hypothetical protein [Parapusillimonas granuli]NYT51945.1 hypothetical protein [Parapusillimonas granuli]